MIEFVNAKINIGLQIVEKRKDGYHNLQTVFYPVGKYAGMPSNPEVFCDILEVTAETGSSTEFVFSGHRIDCPPEKNLVCRAVDLFRSKTGFSAGLRVALDKHLPDGAGMGGGSADASFTLVALNKLRHDLTGRELGKDTLAAMALELGADCPFFIHNRPMLGEGIGEILENIAVDLKGMWLVVVKPHVYISTKDAFSGIRPRAPKFDLHHLPDLAIEEWQDKVINDFEESIFPKFPELAKIKRDLLELGALYSSMSGSGSSIYGIFRRYDVAEEAKRHFQEMSTIDASYLLEL